MSRHTLHALMLLDAIQLFSSCSTGWADRMAVLCVSVCLSLPGVSPAGWLPASPIPSLPGQFWLWAPLQRVPGSPPVACAPMPT